MVFIGLFDIVVRKIPISRTINEMFLLTPFVSSTNEKGKVKLDFNPLNPNIKIEILICYLYTFSIEVVERIC